MGELWPGLGLQSQPQWSLVDCFSSGEAWSAAVHESLATTNPFCPCPCTQHTLIMMCMGWHQSTLDGSLWSQVTTTVTHPHQQFQQWSHFIFFI
jgi:hypothetical protein